MSLPAIASPLPSVPLPFARGTGYAAYFEQLAAHPADAALLRRLLLHADAALAADERVALYRVLWRCAALAAAPDRAEAEAAFDGRHALLLAWCDLPFEHPSTLERLARAHLPGAGTDWRGKPDARFVIALLAAPADLSPALQLIALQAQLFDSPWAGLTDAARAQAWQQAALDAAPTDATCTAAAWRVLFQLALAAGDADTATALLAECVACGAHAELPPQALRRWLEGDDNRDGAAPLQLESSLQTAWLQPADLQHGVWRQVLHAALSRPGPRARVAALHTRLGDGGEPHALPPRQRQAFKALARLDKLYHAARQGGPVTAADGSLAIDSKCLGKPAIAALYHHAALRAVAAGDAHAALIALANARAAGGAARSAPLMQDLVAALDPVAWHDVTAQRGAAAGALLLGGDWAQEQALWQALAARANPAVAAMARYQLALLYSDGSFEPCATRKCAHDAQARGLWSALAQQPAYAAAARARLAHPGARTEWQHAVQQGAQRHVFVPAREPGADRLLIVFACFETHHGFAQLSLAQGVPGHHLLFLQNPALNWYADTVFDDICALIDTQVLTRFAPSQVSCYFGSMGGHAALKFALRFGFQAVVFNPQTDLDLWAAFRPGQRALLWATQRHRHVAEHPVAAFEGSPVYYMVGSGTADREAFALWLQRVQRCRHGHFIVEKFDDAAHAGLIARQVAQDIPSALLAITARLTRLTAQADIAATHAALPDALLPRFWQRLERAAALKIEIVIRDGRVWVADSVHTGTR